MRRRWINTRVAIDMATGTVLAREGFFHWGPVALAEGQTPEQIAAAAAAATEAATKAKDEALAELAKVRKQVADLSGKVMTPEQQKRLEELEAAAAATEEEKKKKAGEWELLKTDLATKHAAEIKERDERAGKLTERFKTTVVQAEFGRASDLFGGDTAKTILDVDLAIAALGRYVHIEDDDQSPLGYKVVIKKANGTPIVGTDGNPLPFAAAMAELIASLPNKDRILRGSGKTGSGSTGGGTTNSGQTEDLDTLTKKVAAGDRDAIKALQDRQRGLGGAIQGTAYAAAAASKK